MSLERGPRDALGGPLSKETMLIVYGNQWTRQLNNFQSNGFRFSLCNTQLRPPTTPGSGSPTEAPQSVTGAVAAEQAHAEAGDHAKDDSAGGLPSDDGVVKTPNQDVS